MSTPADTIKQLNSARDIVLRDPTIYPQVVPGVLPVIGPSTTLEQRRWGADFLAETFASPVVSGEDKEKMCIGSGVLDTLRGYLNRKEDMGQDEDPAVVKSAVQCAASIYPLVFRHTMNSSNDEAWRKLATIKSSILRRMDTAPSGVRICCVKFVAMVVQVQTPGLIADPRRQEQNEISLALVPREHAVLKVGMLEAEASGLLDRLMYVLQDDAVDALLVTATLNAVSILVQRRASIGNKILGIVLNFNPLKLASRAMSGRDKVSVRSMTRTTMTFLLHVLKRNPHHILAGRIQQHIERLRHTLIQAFSDANQLKRPAQDEPTDGLDDAKRQRIEKAVAIGAAATAPQQTVQPSTQLPYGASVAQLFTLSDDKAANGFHVTAIPYNIVTQLIPPLMQMIDQKQFDEAINIVKARYLNVSKQQPPPDASSAARAAIDDDDEDDYDPSMTMAGDAEQVLNRLDQMPPEGFEGPGVAIGPFKLPPPEPLSDREKDEYSKTTVTRVFDTLAEMDRDARQKGVKKQELVKGFNRPAVPTHDRDGWLSLVTRLATRTQFDLQDGENEPVKQENGDRTLAKKGNNFSLSTGIREALLNYVMENFRARITVAISWLNEEWYCDRILQKQKGAEGSTETTPTYNSYTLRLLDSMIPYLDTKDNKVLIRLVSEIPHLPAELFPKLRKIADDPERVNLVVQALLYLVMFRPPARESALDALEALWRENEDARKPAERHLARWRPEVVEKGIDGAGEVKAEA
jgi:symplekin